MAELHPGEGSDADIFDRCGLLTGKSVMAHAVHLNRDDADLLRSGGTGSAIARGGGIVIFSCPPFFFLFFFMMPTCFARVEQVLE